MLLDELQWVDSVDSEMKQSKQWLSIPLEGFQMMSNGTNSSHLNLFILSLVT